MLDSIGVVGEVADEFIGVAGVVAGAVPLSPGVASLGVVLPGVVVLGVVPAAGTPGFNGAVEAGTFVSAVRREPLVLPTNLIASMQKKIQTNAVMIVTRVNTSPALVPKALCPPMPPKAPAKPPPLPCWINTKAIKNSDERTNNVPIKN